MPILEHCFCCTLRVAASVISVYVAVAYMIAFFMELWWVWDTGGKLPHLGYILISAYFVTFILSTILVKGISDRQMPHLILWLFGILAILLPEGGLVLFMTFQFWKIYTIYGLTEITFWLCRLIVNVAGLICIYSLYKTWKEEKEVLTSLRDLNMASGAHILANGRRLSVSNRKIPSPAGYVNPVYSSEVDSPIIIPRTNLKRTPSMISLPPRAASPSPSLNEFNAALYKSSMKSRSVLDLRPPIAPTASPQLGFTPRPSYDTQSLDRRLLHRTRSMGFFPTEDRMRNGATSTENLPPEILDIKNGYRWDGRYQGGHMINQIDISALYHYLVLLLIHEDEWLIFRTKGT